MNSRRNFLRELARAAAPGGREPASGEAPPPGASPADAAGEPPAHAGLERYADQLGAAGWGVAAQGALREAGVLVVGLGALGSPVAAYLAAAGVGRLGVLDDGLVTEPALHRQHLHFAPDVGVPKAHSAAVKLGFLNPDVVVEPYQARFEAANADGLLAGQDLVVDCSNAAVTRELVNAACCRAGVALVTAQASGRSGSVLTVDPSAGGCLRCLSGDSRATGAEPAQAPLLGPLAGVVGSLQALVALERLARADGPAAPGGGELIEVDLGAPALRRTAVARREGCPDCGGR